MKIRQGRLKLENNLLVSRLIPSKQGGSTLEDENCVRKAWKPKIKKLGAEKKQNLHISSISATKDPTKHQKNVTSPYIM